MTSAGNIIFENVMVYSGVSNTRSYPSVKLDRSPLTEGEKLEYKLGNPRGDLVTFFNSFDKAYRQVPSLPLFSALIEKMAEADDPNLEPFVTNARTLGFCLSTILDYEKKTIIHHEKGSYFVYPCNDITLGKSINPENMTEEILKLLFMPKDLEKMMNTLYKATGTKGVEIYAPSSDAKHFPLRWVCFGARNDRMVILPGGGLGNIYPVIVS